MKLLGFLQKVFCSFILFFVLFAFFATETKAAENINISPVVQLISYRGIYGKYVEMLGWGSASIINNEGVIISNNHVVDDGTGNLANAFNVCVTKKEKERPVCDYTATLIARDDTLDISILKIDPKDVYGNTVNYADFQSIEIDFDYVPKNQDEIVIVGYPWIGADTITETKGIVSGITEYNDYKYIKTDALIAGGNSGGAMISEDGKLVGVPTFTIGGFFEASLGYGLSIKEAETFIKENIKQPVVTKETSINFSAYQKDLDAINKKQILQDDLIKIAFGADYEIKNYIKNRYIQLVNKTQKDITIWSLNVDLVQTPEIKEEKHFFYYAQKLGFYDENYKLLKKNIGGLSFFTPVYKSDVTGGNTNWGTLYFNQISPRMMLVINVEAGLWDEKNNAEIKAEMEKVLGFISFSKDKITSLENEFTFDLPSPSIQIQTDKMSISNDRNGLYTQFLGNLYESFSIFLEEKYLYSGKGKTFQEIYDAETENINPDYKALIKLKGHNGYIVCDSAVAYSFDYNYYYPYSSLDENGLPLPELKSCLIKILDGVEGEDNKEYFLVVRLTGAKNKISQELDFVNNFLSNNLVIEKTATGETRLINLYKNLIDLKFSDIEKQSMDYKNLLRFLIKYNLLKNNDKFHGDYPLYWKDAIVIYLKAVYNADFSESEKVCKASDKICLIQKARLTVQGKSWDLYDLIVNDLKIDLNAHVPQDKIYYFERILRYKLAGVSLKNYSEKEINDFESNQNEPKYEKELEKLKVFDNAIYGKRKITIYDLGIPVGVFYQEKEAVFYPGEGIVFEEIYDDKTYDFNTVKSKDQLTENQHNEVIQNFNNCLKTKTSRLTCIEKYLVDMSKLLQEDQRNLEAYSVLTKAGLYDFILPSIDFGLFDPEIAKKKEVTIDLKEE